MDWKDVAKVIAPLAPTLGGVLGGFIPIPGGALAGQLLGNIIAKQFGVPATPEAVHGAITSNPNEVVLAKLAAATEQAKAEIEGYARIEEARAQAAAAGSANVGETMRAEIGHEHWFFNGWRPTAGWLFNFFAMVDGIVLSLAIWRAGSGDQVLLNAIKDAQVLVGAHLASLAAIVGVYIVGRSSEKGKAIEANVPPPVAAKVIKR